MKKSIAILAILFTMAGQAQVSKVTIQASGLTCSLCSNAINKALKSVPYIDNVTPNIKQSSFEVTFKPGASVHFDDLKKKVEDAGFFVARFTATMQFDNIPVSPDAHVNIGGMMVHFLHVKDKVLSGEQEIQVLDKGYVSAKEFRKNAVFTKMDCYKTGVAGSCCTKSGTTAGKRIYHITI